MNDGRRQIGLNESSKESIQPIMSPQHTHPTSIQQKSDHILIDVATVYDEGRDQTQHLASSNHQTMNVTIRTHAARKLKESSKNELRYRQYADRISCRGQHHFAERRIGRGSAVAWLSMLDFIRSVQITSNVVFAGHSLIMKKKKQTYK